MTSDNISEKLWSLIQYREFDLNSNKAVREAWSKALKFKAIRPVDWKKMGKKNYSCSYKYLSSKEKRTYLSIYSTVARVYAKVRS